MDNMPSDYPPEHWLKCAEEVRTEAAKMKNLTVKRELETIAQGYERLASHAAIRRIHRKPKT